ncbi:hypothetical protein RhiirA4_474616 [Rhizophagus irregularis]|uniref:Uncharacterized protein n=1 Tax=Rhizophagus irregularis TaxID=588596 RepID=A0A2I1H8T2_9GLOM|nr:hypothetical protein RhiirA4_474616 [Rhizophagus irregularis]
MVKATLRFNNAYEQIYKKGREFFFRTFDLNLNLTHQQVKNKFRWRASKKVEDETVYYFVFNNVKDMMEAINESTSTDTLGKRLQLKRQDDFIDEMEILEKESVEQMISPQK